MRNLSDTGGFIVTSRFETFMAVWLMYLMFWDDAQRQWLVIDVSGQLIGDYTLALRNIPEDLRSVL